MSDTTDQQRATAEQQEQQLQRAAAQQLQQAQQLANVQVAIALIEEGIQFESSLRESVRLWNFTLALSDLENRLVKVSMYVSPPLFMASASVRMKEPTDSLCARASNYLIETMPFVRVVRHPGKPDTIWVRAEFPVDTIPNQGVLPLSQNAVKMGLQVVAQGVTRICQKFAGALEPMTDGEVYVLRLGNEPPSE